MPLHVDELVVPQRRTRLLLDKHMQTTCIPSGKAGVNHMTLRGPGKWSGVCDQAFTKVLDPAFMKQTWGSAKQRVYKSCRNCMQAPRRQGSQTGGTFSTLQKILVLQLP